MAKKNQTETTETTAAAEEQVTGTIHYMDPHDIIARPEDNGRVEEHTESSIADMARTLKSRGQLQPVIIRADPDGGKPFLVFGFRRHAAALKLREKDGAFKLAAVYKEYEDEQQHVLDNLAENSQRKATTPLDDAHNLHRLVKPISEGGFGMTQDEAARATNRSQPWVSRTLRLLDLPDEVQEFVKEKQIQLNSAIVMVDAPKEFHDEVLSGKVKLSPDQLKSRREQVEAEIKEAGGEVVPNTKGTPRVTKDGKTKAKPGVKKKAKNVLKPKELEQIIHKLLTDNGEGAPLHTMGVLLDKLYTKKMSPAGFCRRVLALIIDSDDGSNEDAADAADAASNAQGEAEGEGETSAPTPAPLPRKKSVKKAAKKAARKSAKKQE